MNLAADPSSYVKYAVSENPSATEQMLRAVFTNSTESTLSWTSGYSDSRHSMFQNLCRHPNSGHDFLRLLARSTNQGSDLQVLLDRDLPFDLYVDLLGRDSSSTFKQFAAKSRRERASQLTNDEWGILARAPQWSGRVIVATNRSTPVEILDMLSLDPDLRVRRSVHANRTSSPEIRAKAAILGV